MLHGLFAAYDGRGLPISQLSAGLELFSSLKQVSTQDI
jgi:hypothetical protein